MLYGDTPSQWSPLRVTVKSPPLKIYMEPKTGGLEDDFPIQLGDF